jgi:hypothetical protein
MVATLERTRDILDDVFALPPPGMNGSAGGHIMNGRCVRVRPRPAAPAICAVRRYVAREVTSLRDAVRAADLPLPIAVVLASVCSLVVVISGGGAP